MMEVVANVFTLTVHVLTQTAEFFFILEGIDADFGFSLWCGPESQCEQVLT